MLHMVLSTKSYFYKLYFLRESVHPWNLKTLTLPSNAHYQDTWRKAVKKGKMVSGAKGGSEH